MADRGDREIDNDGEIAHAQLLGDCQGVQNPQPRRIAQRGKQPTQPLDVPGGQGVLLGIFDRFGVDLVDGTGVAIELGRIHMSILSDLDRFVKGQEEAFENSGIAKFKAAGAQSLSSYLLLHLRKSIGASPAVLYASFPEEAMRCCGASARLTTEKRRCYFRVARRV